MKPTKLIIALFLVFAVNVLAATDVHEALIKMIPEKAAGSTETGLNAQISFNPNVKAPLAKILGDEIEVPVSDPRFEVTFAKGETKTFTMMSASLGECHISSIALSGDNVQDAFSITMIDVTYEGIVISGGVLYYFYTTKFSLTAKTTAEAREYHFTITNYIFDSSNKVVGWREYKNAYFTVMEGTLYTFFISTEDQSLASTDKIGLRGSVSPLTWDSSVLLSETDDESIYKTTVAFDEENVEQELEFKFVIEHNDGSTTYEDEVGPVGLYGNRNVFLSSCFQDLPVLTFNKEATLISFYVDMGNTVVENDDIIGIRGSLLPLSWDSSIQMKKLPDSEIYLKTVAFADNYINQNLEYKFIIEHQDGTADWEGKVGSGGDYGNRAVLLPRGYIVLPTVNFNSEFTDLKTKSIFIIGEYNLDQNYPNPFNPATTISYSLESAGKVMLTIFNLQGAEIKTLVNENQAAGAHQIQWDGTNRAGEKVASGLYFYTLKTAANQITKQMMLVK